MIDDADWIILIFDVWRPQIELEERCAITALFEAVDSYGCESPPVG